MYKTIKYLSYIKCINLFYKIHIIFYDKITNFESFIFLYIRIIIIILLNNIYSFIWKCPRNNSLK